VHVQDPHLGRIRRQPAPEKGQFLLPTDEAVLLRRLQDPAQGRRHPPRPPFLQLPQERAGLAFRTHPQFALQERGALLVGLARRTHRAAEGQTGASAADGGPRPKDRAAKGPGRAPGMPASPGGPPKDPPGAPEPPRIPAPALPARAPATRPRTPAEAPPR
jgi:hypothetical protein